MYVCVATCTTCTRYIHVYMYMYPVHAKLLEFHDNCLTGLTFICISLQFFLQVIQDTVCRPKPKSFVGGVLFLLSCSYQVTHRSKRDAQYKYRKQLALVSVLFQKKNEKDTREVLFLHKKRMPTNTVDVLQLTNLFYRNKSYRMYHQ